MIVGNKVYEAIISIPVIIPTPQQLFDLQIERLRSTGIITNPDEFLNLRRSLPESGLFLLFPQTNLSLSELMVRVVVDGRRGQNRLDGQGQHVKNIVKTPKRHYIVTDIEDGREMLNISPANAIQAFSQKKRYALTAKEGVFLAICFPEILKHHFIDLCGSRCWSDGVIFLWLGSDRPELGWSSLGSASSSWGAASCGSRVRRGGS
ncbi:MAG: hypothetical protein UT37_C0010G0003 [Parcubacteria group bacterium GW2011_GWA2_39_18]|nr:MAG: hypothetical protein UT37_C0010G0003 [Parcubacteria group bacterium GW2011_GWA2_39_18]